MGHNVLRLSHTAEGSVSGSPVTVSLPWQSRQIVVSNDSSSNNLTVTLGSGSPLTLRPTETLSVNIWVRSVTFNGTAAYRLWAFG